MSESISKTSARLFGTDGIRGEAGVFPLDPDSLFLLGQAAADVLNQSGAEACCVIGQDTRSSSDGIRDSIIAGLNSRGMKALNAGVVPTPAVAFLTKKKKAAFGIVISASHNPYQDNGVKFFAADAYKLDEQIEKAVESRLRELIEAGKKGQTDLVVAVEKIEDAVEAYVDYVCAGITSAENNELPLAGRSIALDCANGASYQTSAAILQKLGAQVISFFDQPSGENINLDCGCTHPAVIEKLVRENQVDLGISHDGDADRLCLCDENAKALDGDELLTIAGLDMIQRGLLKEHTLVATTMSNGGLDVAIEAAGGQVLRTGVGDRQVIAQMRAGDYSLGGEQSGHIIFHPPSTTGDGIVAAVQVLAVVGRTGKPLSELRRAFQPFPQVQRNLVMSSKPPLSTFVEAQALISETESALGKSGRVMLRYSGTELLLRLLIEGPDEKDITQRADAIVAAIRKHSES